MPFDYSEKREDLVPSGTYEATADCQGVSMNNFGEEVIRLSWKIRTDVEQQAQGRIVFDDIRREKDDPERFSDRKLYDIIYGGQSKDNPNSKFKFDDYDEICQHLNGLNMKIDVDIKTANSGRRFNVVRFGGYHPTEATGKTVGQPAVQTKNTEAIEVSDDDLPF